MINISKKLKIVISKYIDHLIPFDSKYQMPCASKAIKIEEFIKEVVSLDNFEHFAKNIIKVKKFALTDKYYSDFLENEYAEKFENDIFKLVFRHYFSSEVVLDSLSKKNELINQDYTNLISNSEMIEKLIKKTDS